MKNWKKLKKFFVNFSFITRSPVFISCAFDYKGEFRYLKQVKKKRLWSKHCDDKLEKFSYEWKFNLFYLFNVRQLFDITLTHVIHSGWSFTRCYHRSMYTSLFLYDVRHIIWIYVIEVEGWSEIFGILLSNCRSHWRWTFLSFYHHFYPKAKNFFHLKYFS